MGVSSYFEFVTTLFGWAVYARLWDLVADTGIVYIPILAIFIGNITNSRRGGDDEGSAGIQSLKKIETDLALALFVLLFAGVPFVDVTLAEMKFVRPTLDCRVVDNIASGKEPAEVTGTNTGTSYDRVLSTIAGETGRIPIWWGFLHILTKSVVSSSLASIPCSGDMSSVQMRLENTPFEDPRVSREVQEFINDCFMPAKSQFLRRSTVAGLTPDQIDELNWVGSRFYLTQPGYYDKFYSNRARPEFAFDAVRDGGYEADANIGGHPTCAEWWNDSNSGLRNKVLGSIDEDLVDEYVTRPRNLIQAATADNVGLVDRQNILLRKFLAVKNAQANISGWTNNLSLSYAEPKARSQTFAGIQWLGNTLQESAMVAVAGVGAAISTPGHAAAGMAAREGSTIFLSLLLMVFVSVLPFLLIFSSYKLSTLITLTIVFFGLHFFYVMWGIAFWIDNNLTNAIMSGSGSAGVFTAIANPTQTFIMVWIQRFLYIVFPMIWLSSLTWIGVRAGEFATQAGGMSKSTSEPMQRGGNSAVTMATGGRAK